MIEILINSITIKITNTTNRYTHINLTEIITKIITLDSQRKLNLDHINHTIKIYQVNKLK